jgi:excisionase family DNA binding protein
MPAVEAAVPATPSATPTGTQPSEGEKPTPPSEAKANSATPARRPMTAAERNQAVAEWLRQHAAADPKTVTIRHVSEGVGCSIGAVKKTPAWKAFVETRQADTLIALPADVPPGLENTPLPGEFSTTPNKQPELIGVADLAKLLGVSQRTVWSLRYRGELPAPFKLGGLIRWRRATVFAWLAEREAAKGK